MRQQPEIAPRVSSPSRPGVEAVVTSVGVACLAGVIAGLAVGGIGGRVAMRVLVLTTDDRLDGITSDDGFAIDRFSVDTLNLVLACGLGGALAGGAYGLLRMALRGGRWVVAAGVAVAVGASAGAAIVNVDGIDFILLEPLWLTVALFVALPAAWGSSVVLLTEWLLRPGVLYARPPEGVDRRIGGVVVAVLAWSLVALLAAAGVADLRADLDALS
ncbi:MAG: hypothetical protein AB7V62_02165 [Thermoleophilia bacterium]